MRHPFQTKSILPCLVLCATLASVSLPSSAQNARTFTYDAAGNRVAMGVPVQQAPGRNPNGNQGGLEASFDIAIQPGGHVRLMVKKLEKSEKYAASIYTTSGQLVASLAPTDNPVSNINMSSLQAGVYVVKLTIGKRQFSRVITKE
ncbi:MAG: T9SS type A sorting domain-containing protein [Prevotella sp.]|nr:T9SS type A sorting domain-containing protein [Prevotella sp.]